LDYGIPADAVANLDLRSLTAAAIAERSPLGWAIPILVVVGCNVTSVVGTYVYLVFGAADRSEGIEGGRRGRWSVAGSASPVLDARETAITNMGTMTKYVIDR
jgi:hypothetical protein